MSGWITVWVAESLCNCLGHWLIQCLKTPYRPLIGWVTLSDWNTQSGWHLKIYFTLAEIIPSENSIFSRGLGVGQHKPKHSTLESQSFWEENYSGCGKSGSSLNVAFCLPLPPTPPFHPSLHYFVAVSLLVLSCTALPAIFSPCLSVLYPKGSRST